MFFSDVAFHIIFPFSLRFTLPLDLQGEHEFDLLYFSPILASSGGKRFSVLGDRRKFVPFSGQRLTSVSLSGTALEVTSEGAVPLAVAVSVGGADWAVGTLECEGSGTGWIFAGEKGTRSSHFFKR